MEEKKKQKWLEYLKQLWDKVLAEDTALLGDTKAFQVIESKHKEVTTISSEDKTRQWPPKKTKEK